MKNLKQIAIVAALCMSTLAVFAGGNPDLVIRSEGAKTFVLHLAELKSGQLQIRLLDGNHAQLLTDEGSGNGAFSRKYNLANLPDGDYSLELEDAQSVKSQPIRLLGNRILIDPSHLKIEFKPVFSVREGHVDLTYLLVGQGASATVEIVGADGQGLFREEFGQPGSINRRFLTNRMAPGCYLIKVSANGRSWIDVFKVGA